jgi:serine/threonine protein kinase
MDLKTNETVAIKCLTKRGAANEAGLAFAIDEKSEELALHRRLGFHANIVNLIDSFETDAHVFIVLEFCEQGDLYEAIRIGRGPLETEHVRRFMLELVDAVSYIHSKGIYHRDIKPENIFLSKSGTMKLGDFGLATTDRWSYEATVGSDRYMSPEQYDSAGAGYSPAQADVWAIGVCLLNILFSRNPFTTPTEADPLFLDFSRDKQSLFDVFPSMSQDTYEVIVECMNLDPSKRSLVGARNALRRLVSFTTEDEALDDFCTADRHIVASSNREPLRTPSIQSPQMDTGAFPWAKALHASPQKPIRQLSAIPDDESYTEDLFSKSGTTADWLSAAAQTPSSSAGINSSLGASMQSLAIGRPKMPARDGFKVSPMAGSLPINMTKSKNLPSMSLVFGRKEPVSKSWSDMWDEDAEEEEEHQRQVLKELNSRTWSHESKVDDDNTPRQGQSPAPKPAAIHVDDKVQSIETVISTDIDEDLGADGFFFQESPTTESPPAGVPRYSPPSKRNAQDKWAALGERRRAFTGGSAALKAARATLKAGRQIGNAFDYGALIHGVSGLDAHNQHNASSLFNNNNINNPSSHTPNNNTHTGKWVSNISQERIAAKECPRTKGREQRDWDWNFNWRKETRHDFGDVEWVGGWQETHA